MRAICPDCGGQDANTDDDGVTCPKCGFYSRSEIKKGKKQGNPKKLVPCLDGQIETRLKINQYLISLQMSGMRIKTKEAAVLHAIAQAERVPELENENKKLKEKIRELKEELNGE